MGSEKSVGVLEVENSISSGGLGGKGCSPLSPASLLRGATQNWKKAWEGSWRIQHTVCCSHNDESALTGSQMILEQTFTMLQADGVVPADDGEDEVTLSKGVIKGLEDVLADPKAVELPQEILSLLASP